MGRPSEAWIARQREQKAIELEDIAVEGGIMAADLVDEGVRDRILDVFAQRKGKRRSAVHASVQTWRVVWRLLHDRETRGQGSAPNPFIGQGTGA